MKRFSRLMTLAAGITASIALVAQVSVATAAPAPVVPPKATVSGPQAKAPFAPGTKDAKRTTSLGATAYVKTDASGALSGMTTFAGNVSGIDFQAPMNYCYRGLTYTPIYNGTSSTKYVQVRVYNQGMYRDYYTTIAAYSYSYPAFYGNEGAFTAYLYVWNGTSYAYDEYKAGTNTCNVSVTRTYNTGGWVQLKIQNLGTAYASQQSTELAPYPGSGTYTGSQWDYPVAGGAAIYRWFQVGTSPYAIVSNTYGSYNDPVYFTGDL